MKRRGAKSSDRVTFRSIHMDLMGPRELVHNREAKGNAIDLIRTIEYCTRQLIKDCAKTSPLLKRFRINYFQIPAQLPARRKREYK